MHTSPSFYVSRAKQRAADRANDKWDLDFKAKQYM